MKFSKSDLLFTSIIVLLSTLFSILFVRELNATIFRSGEKQLGTVIFKKKTATRKGGQTLRWERLKNESPVFRGDTLRTASGSEAQVFFLDGTSLDMYENSMLRLDSSSDLPELEILEGSLSLGSVAIDSQADTSRSIARVRIGDSVVEVDPAATVSFLRTGDQVTVDVTSGEARLVSDSGEETLIGENTEVVMNTQTGEASQTIREITPIYPAQGARLLDQRAQAGPITFRFTLANAPDARSQRRVIVDIARDSAFTYEAQEIPVTLEEGFAGPYEVRAPLSSGLWYWRARFESGATSSLRRLTIEQEGLPTLTHPAQDTVCSFKAHPPAVRFSWDSRRTVHSYILEIDNDPDFSSPLRSVRTERNSISLPALEEGIWHWRVRPQVNRELIHAPLSYPSRTFSVVKSRQMIAPTQLIPAHGALYQIGSARVSGLSFSWQPQDEAVSYDLALTDTSGEILFGPFSSRTSYRLVRPDEATIIQNAGTYGWKVRWQDAEGSLSPWSSVRPITAVDARDALSLSFPPDEYRVADSLTENMRLSWKTTVTQTVFVQFARDANFTEERREVPGLGDSILGLRFDTGRWYWRARTFNADGSVFLETVPRSFIVSPPLAQTRLLSPDLSREVLMRTAEDVSFSWAEVPGADGYRVALYYRAPITQDEEALLTDEIEADPVFEQTNHASTSISVPFSRLAEGHYRLSIQAFGLAGSLSTRLVGLRHERDFMARKLHRVELVSPSSGQRLSELGMRTDGIAFVWRNRTSPDTLELVLTKNGKPFSHGAVWKKGERRLTLTGLSEGRYTWTVRAKREGLDIAPVTPVSFMVTPVPPLPAATLVTPAKDAVFGPAELRGMKSLEFTWLPVSGATEYQFRLYQGLSKKPLLERSELTGTSVVLDDLTVLDRGNLFWEVRALRKNSGGKTERDGLVARQRFTIDLPKLTAPDAAGRKEYYGN
ncbi:MAG: FecR domain-containing protein [Spirochaetales bacterium]|nr:FecR domain-containing protein [Spirochaetales bacterium]